MSEGSQGGANDATLERLFVVIAPYNKKGIEVTAETTFAGHLELDSLTIMDLVAAIEDEFDIVLPLNMLPDLETVQQVADLADKLVKER